MSKEERYTNSNPLLNDIPQYGTEARSCVIEENESKSKSSFNKFRHWLTHHLWEHEHSVCRPLLTLAVMTLLVWLLLFVLFGSQVSPSGDLFRLIILVLCAAIAGPLTGLLHLPPLLGMLLVGISLRSIGFYHVSGIYPVIVTNLRQTAMTVILLKAGLGLDPSTLARLSLVVARLGLAPCSVEAMAIAVITHYFLQYPWLWALVLGFLLSAISPAVVVPTLLDLKVRGYGEDKGIPTLVLAACSLDDITSISMFSLFLGMIFNAGDLSQQILQGPIDVMIGLTMGVLWGIICSSLPHKNDSLVAWKRAILVGVSGLCAILGAPKAGFPSAGPLACVTLAFVASVCWKAQGPSVSKVKVTDILSVLWRVLEPMLYAFIGAEIDLRVLDVNTVTWGGAVIMVALLIRVMTCVVVLLGADLRWKEILFVAIAWLPKATVQAALAPLPLAMVQTHESSTTLQDTERASQILTVAVLSILLTSPLGAIGTTIAGRRLLRRTLDS